MPWAKLSDDYATHPKTEVEDLISLAAVGLHAKAIAHCAKHLTDGHVTERWVAGQLHPLPKRQRAAVITRACERGLFEDLPEGGFHVHDYCDYNPSREEVDRQRERAANRQREAREKRRQSVLPWDQAGAA